MRIGYLTDKMAAGSSKANEGAEEGSDKIANEKKITKYAKIMRTRLTMNRVEKKNETGNSRR